MKYLTRNLSLILTILLIANTAKAFELNDSIEQVEIDMFVQSGLENTFLLSEHPAFLYKSSEFTFQTKEDLPEGFLFKEDGEVSWKPTDEQFSNLQNNPMILSFYGRSKEEDEKILGRIVIYAEEKDSSDLSEGEKEEAKNEVASQPQKTIEVEQEPEPQKPLKLILPEEADWNLTSEGESFEFTLKAEGGSEAYRFELIEPQELMGNLDENGQFAWEPDFDVVLTEENEKEIQLQIKVLDDSGESISSELTLHVSNSNRSPVVGELPTFYVQYERLNKYSLKKKGIVYDPDGDSIIFKPVLKDLPQGMSVSDNGEIIWRPSRGQFYEVRRKPIIIGFSIQDYPDDAKSSGSLKVQVSQEDLPPQITIIPNKIDFDLKENEELEFNFFITDPNGEENIVTFDFVSGNASITEDNLKEISSTQFEFSWTPGYDFIQKKNEEEEFNITFYALDRESNKAEKQITVKVTDTENLLEKDRILYDQYRTILESSWNLIQQLNEKEKELNEEYKKSKKGKRNRAIITASLGVVTGLSPVIFLKDKTGQTIVAAIGGTATATLGSLEASGVIGESPAEVMKKLSYVAQKRNDLTVYGNVFASKYALPLERRGSSFQNDLKNLTLQLNLKDVTILELDPDWENPKESTDENIKKIYKDFNPDSRFSENYE